jgi:hypothetical protein
MTPRGDGLPAEHYSPQRRTALLLTGTGTSGAYHAGVLRALHEAGVKIDIVAGRGIGVVGALFAAVDGASRLWEDRGFWRSAAVTHLYPWRSSLRVIVLALATSVALVAVPLSAMAAGLIVFPIDFLLKMVGLGQGGGLTAWYVGVTQAVFAPEALPTWLPRLVLLVLGGASLYALVTAWQRSDARPSRGDRWWHLIPPPLASEPAIALCWSALWDLVRGATQLKQPARQDLARRYTELLAENLGQPGFRELLLTCHDIDAGRDLLFALVNENRRRDLVRRRTAAETEARRAEVLDLSGVARDHLADAVAGALTVPIATDYHAITFAPDAYWRGETHRLCDRPESLQRLVEELRALDVTQIVLVCAAPESPGPHALAAPRIDGRGRIGELLQSSEAAVVRDVVAGDRDPAPIIFTIRPVHNPVGPFDFSGGFDDRSVRPQALSELITRGYEDAYHQFVEPVVGASGDRVGA